MTGGDELGPGPTLRPMAGGAQKVRDDIVRRRVQVRGRVQGVFYRDTCRREAASRAVNGWIRNCRVGSVEAVFEGPKAQVEAMVAWARTGPPSASVTDVSVHEEEPEGLDGFRVR